MNTILWQTTIQKPVSISGKALFSGKNTTIRLLPAPIDSGISFQRIDLAHAPIIPARLAYVGELFRCTRLRTNEGDEVAQVEHLLSALRACGIDNLLIEVEGEEMPILDGSSRTFVALIEEAGVHTQERKKNVMTIVTSHHISFQDTHLVALPAKDFQVSYIFHDPRSKLLQSQYFSYTLAADSYKLDIAPCRTFAFHDDVAFLIEKGLMNGAAIENGIIIQGEKVLNAEGLRFQDELVRHKILDLIGDFSLIGYPLNMHIVAIRSGHASNIALAKKIEPHLVSVDCSV